MVKARAYAENVLQYEWAKILVHDGNDNYSL